MTTPIEKPQTRRTTPSGTCALPPPGWRCGYPAGHDGPCSASQVIDEPPAPDPQPGAAPAASSGYGFGRAVEFDLDLPGGGRVRIRKLRKMQVIDLKIIDILDGFAPELLKDIRSDDPELAAQAMQDGLQAMVDPKTSGKVFGPVNRVVVAAVVCPAVVAHGQTTDEQINVNEIEIDDKMAIFEAAMPDELKSAALGEQLSALKSVRSESEAGVRDLRDGEAVQPETQ